MSGSGASDVVVRDLAPGDRARWQQLWDGYLTFYEEQLTPATTDATWRRLLDRDRDESGGLVAALPRGDDGEVVGLLHYLVHATTWDTRPVCYLEDLFVDPAARGRGAGRALIVALTDRARDRGWSGIYWITRKDNTTARRLYDRVATLSDFVRYDIDLPDPAGHGTAAGGADPPGGGDR